MRGWERTARCRRRYPDRRVKLLSQTNRMSIGATRVDLRSEDKHGMFGGIQTFDDARQRRSIERADRMNLAVE
jgi:hypothetical protein